ncbi:alginate lyase family protein [Litorivicinus sp.]|nr:alginate lyase family protein [Litorivicinus sp.]
MRLLILVILFSSSSFGANFNKKSAPIVQEPINFIVPSDVLADFAKGSDLDKKKFCSASPNSVSLVDSYGSGEKEIPLLIKGYNSRMDNGRDIPFADETGLFILRMSEVVTDAWVFNDEQKKEIALEALNQWASQDGLLKTKSCTRNGRLVQGCTAWIQSDGQDLSDSKDFSTVQMWIMKLANAYFFALSNFRPNDSRHKTIQTWLGEFFERNKRANNVYFGLDHGWFYPAILDRLRRNKSPEALVTKLLKDLDKQVFDDGSMKDRTTRGNRALWYHHDAVKEAMITIEIARTAGVVIPDKLNAKLSKAGVVFVNGYFDHSTLDKWAKEAQNSVYEQGKQDFKNKLNQMPNGHSWFYIFSYRNPHDPLSIKLDDMIRQGNNQAVKDGQIGIGLGCIYAVAKGGSNL